MFQILLMKALMAMAIVHQFSPIVESSPIVDGPIERSIYNSSDHVAILFSTNFSQFVIDGHRDGRKLQLIQFYNSYCGHCIGFAPTFRQFVKSVLSWNDTLTISTVDCSLEINQKICRDYEIEFYPSIRLFWFKPNQTDKGHDFRVAEPKVNLIREAILKWISDTWKKQSATVPESFPRFEPLSGNDQNDLVRQLHLSDQKPALIVIESDQSYLGRTLMMDLNRYSSHLQLYRMVESDIRLLDQILPQTLDHFKLPFLLTINGKDKKFSVIPRPLMTTESNHVYFTKLIRSQFLKDIHFEDDLQLEITNVEPPNDLMIKSSDNNNNGGPHSPQYSSRVYQSDLHNAIRYMLYHEVSLRKSLNIEQTQSLIRLLSILYDHFPFQSTKTRQFVKYILDWLTKKSAGLVIKKKKKIKQQKLDDDSSGATIDIDDLRTTMNLYEDYYHFPELKPYRACADSDPSKKRGYPCSVWTLFHVLTVAEYRRSQQLHQWSSLHPTLYAMREYIRNFFGCTECRDHFVQMASSMENELTYSNSSVLWLWQSHNIVNARLKGTQSEDAVHLPKRQFPTVKECPQCYLETNEEFLARHQKNATTYATLYYNQTMVLDYLVRFYSIERIVQDGEENENGQRENLPNLPMGSAAAAVASKHPKISKFDFVDSNFEIRKKNILFSYVPFTSIDYSLIFIFYVVSIGLLVSLCFFFKLRRNNRGVKNIRRFPI